MKLWKEDCLVNIFKFLQGILDNYLRSKDIVDSLNLQGKLKLPILKWVVKFQANKS